MQGWQDGAFFDIAVAGGVFADGFEEEFAFGGADGGEGDELKKSLPNSLGQSERNDLELPSPCEASC